MRLAPDLLAALRQAAHRRGVTRSRLVELVLIDFVNGTRRSKPQLNASGQTPTLDDEGVFQ
jgi:hypothetical protein